MNAYLNESVTKKAICTLCTTMLGTHYKLSGGRIFSKKRGNIIYLIYSYIKGLWN